MRTTVTLDPDVERLLKTTAHQRGKSFKVVLNEAVRQSLRPKKKTSSKHTLLPAHDLGILPGMTPQKMRELEGDLEIEAYLKTTRRLLEARKPSGHGHT
jgi:hypothetical protein